MEPLRARRRRELRAQLSETALGMFLERGYDEVRVSDIARAVGVSTKTVFNHFPTKEALIADRWESMVQRVETLSNNATTPAPALDIARQVLSEELEVLLAPPDGAVYGSALDELARFRELVESTPALRTYEYEAMARLTELFATVPTDSTKTTTAGKTPHGPRPDQWIAAVAIAGLWQVFYRSIAVHLHPVPTSGRADQVVRRGILHDLDAAIDALRAGL